MIKPEILERAIFGMDTLSNDPHASVELRAEAERSVRNLRGLAKLQASMAAKRQ
jgi:hypothetical protein